MSALEIKARHGKGGNLHCDGFRGEKRCQSSGRYRALIFGYPAASLCRTHARFWRAFWDDALAGFPEQEEAA